MHRKLLLAAFEKASEYQKKQGVLNPSINASAKVLSNYIEEETNFPFSSRSLRDYYNKAVKEIENDIEIKQQKVLQGLCVYLEYENYVDFVNSNSKQKEEVIKAKKHLKKERNLANGMPMKVKIGIGALLALGVILFFVLSPNQPAVMKWEVDHYEKARFSAEGIQNGTLKLYKEDRIKNFKQVDTDCNTVFFNPNGSVKIWYGKNSNGELEFFTDIGLHPNTGKTLKPITKYIIDKYICYEY